MQVFRKIHAGLLYTITIYLRRVRYRVNAKKRERIKKQMEQHAKFSFCRSFDSPSGGLREGRKGAPAIIISAALPIIAIVLTNAQIAFQIAPPWENRAQCQRCRLFNTDEKTESALRRARTIKRDRTDEIKRKRGKVSSSCGSGSLRGNAVIAGSFSIVFLRSLSMMLYPLLARGWDLSILYTRKSCFRVTWLYSLFTRGNIRRNQMKTARRLVSWKQSYGAVLANRKRK